MQWTALRAATDAETLGLNSKHLAWLNDADCANRGWHEGRKVFKRIADGAEYDDDDELSLAEILLKREVAISSQQHGEAGRFSGIEQLPVLEPSPGLLLDRPNVMPNQEGSELPGQLLVKQDAHVRSRPHGRLPARQRPARETP